MADIGDKVRRRSIRNASQNSYLVSRNAKIERREKVKKVSEILKKPEHERTAADTALVNKNPEIVKASQNNARRLKANKERLLEIEDEPDVLLQKCEQLADLIKTSRHVIVYTGAGISTAASIPDYRGPNGVWTLLKKGQELSPQDLSDAEPTYTHMSLTRLYRIGKVKHIVSQNCDGLHMRSGFPRHALSEVHGNMFIEICYNCAPHREYVRLFDVTERTGVHRHITARRCKACGGNLKDTIVHFGEKGKLKSPYRWKEAVRAAKNADLILCLGSSLKVLRKYTCLWCMDTKPQFRPKLVIVNLQWTPKDDMATLKINGKCDSVMMKVMKLMDQEVPEYKRETDPIFQLCSPLRVSEMKTTSKKILNPPPCVETPIKPGRKSKAKASKRSPPKPSPKMVKKEETYPCDTPSGMKDHADASTRLFANSDPVSTNPDNENNANFIKEEKEEVKMESKISTSQENMKAPATTTPYPVMRNLLGMSQSSHKTECSVQSVKEECPDSDDFCSSGVTTSSLQHDSKNGVAEPAELMKASPSLKCTSVVADHTPKDKLHVKSSITEQLFDQMNLQEHDVVFVSLQEEEMVSIPLQGENLTKHEDIDKSTSAPFFSVSSASLNDSPASTADGMNKEKYHCKKGTIPEIVVIDLGENEWVDDSREEKFGGLSELMQGRILGDIVVTSAEASHVSKPYVPDVSPDSTSVNIRLDTGPYPTDHFLARSTALQVSESLGTPPLALKMSSESQPVSGNLQYSCQTPTSFSALSQSSSTFCLDDAACGSKSTVQNSSPMQGTHYILNLSSLGNEGSSPVVLCGTNLDCDERDVSVVKVNLSPEISEVTDLETIKCSSLSSSHKASYICTTANTTQCSVLQTNEVGRAHVLQRGIMKSQETPQSSDHQNMCQKQQGKTSDSLPTFGSAFGKVKDVCLDHCYTQSTMLPQVKATRCNESDIPKTVESFRYVNITSSHPAILFSTKKLISHTVSSDITGNQHGHSIYQDEYSVTERDLKCNTSFHDHFQAQQIIESSQPSSRTSNGAIDKSVIGGLLIHPPVSRISDVNISVASHSSASLKDESKELCLNDVPMCILNMDDIEINDKLSDGKPQATHCCKSSPPRHSRIHLMAQDFQLPSDCSILHLPLQNPHFILGKEHSEMRPHVSSLVAPETQSSVHPNSIVSRTVVSNLLSNARDSDTIEMKPGGKLLEMHGTHDMHPSKDEQSWGHIEKQILSQILKPEEGVKKEIMKSGDRHDRQHLKDTSQTIQENMDLKLGLAVEVEMKKAPSNSEIVYASKGADHNTRAESKNGGRENVCRKLFKRKQAQPSVPGWFGKGLGMKRKKR